MTDTLVLARLRPWTGALLVASALLFTVLVWVMPPSSRFGGVDYLRPGARLFSPVMAGFGLLILHSLVRRRFVYVRRSRLCFGPLRRVTLSDIASVDVLRPQISFPPGFKEVAVLTRSGRQVTISAYFLDRPPDDVAADIRRLARLEADRPQP